MKTMTTIQEVLDDYKAQRAESIGKDYRDIVDIIHNESRLDIEIPNSDYSHALYLTDLMFQDTSKNIRMLNGISEGCDWLEALRDNLVAALKRIERKHGGFLKAILVGKGAAPDSIVKLRKEFKDTVQFVTATSPKPIKHFIICDDCMLRSEELHGPITPDTASDNIHASVYLNSPPRAKEKAEEFDMIWDYLSQHD